MSNTIYARICIFNSRSPIVINFFFDSCIHALPFEFTSSFTRSPSIITARAYIIYVHELHKVHSRIYGETVINSCSQSFFSFSPVESQLLLPPPLLSLIFCFGLFQSPPLLFGGCRTGPTHPLLESRQAHFEADLLLKFRDFGIQ